MEDESSLYLTLPAGTKRVPFGKLPRMIAEALHRSDSPDEELQIETGFKLATAQRRLETELVDDARAGRLKVLDPLTFGPHNFAKGSSLPEALVKVSDLQEYLSGRGTQVRLREPAESNAPVPTVAADAAPLKHWKMRVQAEAAAEWLRVRKTGANPTRASIRPHLLKWCRAENVLTPLGVNPSDGYLRTHVLGGKHWTPPTN